MSPRRYGCNHKWVRDDATSKVCLRCKKRATIEDGDFNAT